MLITSDHVRTLLATPATGGHNPAVVVDTAGSEPYVVPDAAAGQRVLVTRDDLGLVLGGSEVRWELDPAATHMDPDDPLARLASCLWRDTAGWVRDPDVLPVVAEALTALAELTTSHHRTPERRAA